MSPTVHLKLFSLVVCCNLCQGLPEAHCQQFPVERATHETAATLPQLGTSDQQVTFAQQGASVGDRVAQRVGVELSLKTTIEQAGQTAHQGSGEMRRRQERRIEVLEVAKGQVRKAKATFALSRQMSPEGEQPGEEVVQVVEGKSYLVTRVGDRLEVTTLDGDIPTLEEFEIVVRSLETLGLPNPLARFLLGRTLSVGDRLEVPREIAIEAMGFAEFGNIEEFDLLLKEIRWVDEQPCAVFASSIQAVGTPENPIRIHAEGTVVIEVPTCRTLEATLSGPLSLSAQQQGYQYNANGSLLVAIRTKYGDATR